ncbi:MAG: diguanylate cyclase [Alphaproteobacteria bacterium]|nr:diguanylate cyclase [Alphaproteobacteria bacterium]
MEPYLKPDDIADSAPSLADRLGLDPAEIKTLSAFSPVGALTDADIAELHALLDPHVPAITEAFYDRLLSFPELARFLADGDRVHKLNATMQAYLRDLGVGLQTRDYLEKRLNVGVVHERIGLGPTWYLAAYALLSDEIIGCLARACAADAAKFQRVTATLEKVLYFDASLGIHAYHQASVDTLEKTLAQVERAEAKLKRLSRLDGLTGALNRNALMESIESELERYRRYGHEFSLLFLDLDHFKTINDTHGHGFGDHVLKETVTRIHDSIRAFDAVGRYGGEELVVVLVECGQKQAQLIAERVRRHIADHPFHKRRSGTSVNVTVSIGLYTVRRPNIKSETVLRHADRAMYAAKAAGRNQVVIYSRDLEPEAR